MNQNIDYAEIIEQLAGQGQMDTASVKVVKLSPRLGQVMKRVEVNRGGKQRSYVYAYLMKGGLVVGSFQEIGNVRAAPSMTQRKRWRCA